MTDAPSRPASRVVAAVAALPHTGNPATDAALAILGAAVAGGVRDIVVCPGSRSQALALVAAELERIGAVQLHVRIDERSAAFFALGLARESRRPVPVIVTSGTAVANLHPALLEAWHTGVPLVALTADRPPELIGIGANQATVQPGMFGPLIPCITVPPADSGFAANASVPGENPGHEPVSAGRSIARARRALHVNAQFRDPLSVAIPSLDTWWEGMQGAAVEPTPDSVDAGGPPALILPADATPTVVVAGADAGSDAESLAYAGGWPLIAEASSGARFGRHLVVRYRELLRDEAMRAAIRRVVVFGHPTLSREVAGLLGDAGRELIVVEGAGERVVADDRVAARPESVAAEPLPVDERGAAVRSARRRWLAAWLEPSRELEAASSTDAPAPALDEARASDSRARAAFARAEVAVGREPVNREMLADAVWRATWPHDRLVLGASRLIRVLDGRVPGKRIPVHANRGLAGIDGTIATAAGIAVASQRGDAGRSSEHGVTRVLLGDLTFLHDAASLLAAPAGESSPRMQLIVGNDGEGTIFRGLEVRETAGEAFERVLATPVTADLGAIARAYGWHHALVRTRAELDAALVAREHDRVVIEVPLDPA